MTVTNNMFIISLYFNFDKHVSFFAVVQYFNKMNLFVTLVFILVFLISAMVLSKPQGLPPGPMA